MYSATMYLCPNSPISVVIVAIIGSMLIIDGPQCVGGSFWDGWPIISQIKSAFQAISGDTEGARKTQENFVRQAPIISQTTSAIQAAMGDTKGAEETQKQFLHETLEPLPESIPVVGHVVGGIHIAAGNKERGEAIIKGASSNTAAIVGGIFGGPAGAIAAGAAADSLITGIDSAVHGEFRPHGTVDTIDRQAKGELSSGDLFDFGVGIGAEFVGGKVAKDKIGKGKSGGAGKLDDASKIGDPKAAKPNFESSPNEVRIDMSKIDDHHVIDIDPPDSGRLLDRDSVQKAGQSSPDYWLTDPLNLKKAIEWSGLGPEHKIRLTIDDFRVINDVGLTKNCYYCTIAKSAGMTVTQLEMYTGIKFHLSGGNAKNVHDLYRVAGFDNVKHIIKDASPDVFRKELDKIVTLNEERKFALGYNWKVGEKSGGHMVNFEAWRNKAGELKTIIKDFQQPPYGGHPVSGVTRFSAHLPDAAYLFDLFDLGISRDANKRRRRRSTIDLVSARAKTGLDEEHASRLDSGDFDVINDVHSNEDGGCMLCHLAALKGKTLSKLMKELENSIAHQAPSINSFVELYNKVGINDVRVSKGVRRDDFKDLLNQHLNKEENVQFTLVYWPRGDLAGGLRSLIAKVWKTSDGKIELITTDYGQPPLSASRFATSLPDDALWLYAVTPVRIRQIDMIKSSAGIEYKDRFKRLAANAGPGGYKCGQGKRVIGYVTNWSRRPFTIKQSLGLTNAIYAFMEMGENGKLSLSNNTMSRERLIDLIIAKRAHFDEGLKFDVSFAIGGWANSEHFSTVLSNQNSRQFLISEIKRVIKTYFLDGVDIDWEYPITGGATEGKADDKANYVTFLRELRENLGQSRLISIAAGAGQEAFAGFDVAELVKYVDWIGVMTYDFFGAWDSKWGAFVGPLAPIRYGAPPGYSGKLNADWAIKQYVCNSNGLNGKIVMGVPFYGRFWYKTRPGKYDANYPLYRMAERLFNGSFGGEVAYWQILEEWRLNETKKYQKHWDERSLTPWATDGSLVLTYENERSISEKVKYAIDKNLGGLMIWATDHDDRQDTLLFEVFDGACGKLTATNELKFKCNPLGAEKRWWTWLEDKDKAGMCGKNAPLYNGSFYPHCDPDDPGYACCSKHGYCGSGDAFCKCDGCVDYGANPELLVAEPVKPSQPIQWHVGFDVVKVGEKRCGPNAQKLPDGGIAICNPDSRDYCCSPWGFCGSGDNFCACKDCFNNKTNS